MATLAPDADRELRLECARLVMAFGAPGEPTEAAERLFRYIRNGDCDPLPNDDRKAIDEEREG